MLRYAFCELAGRIPLVCRWNFDDVCHSFGDITTSGNLAAILVLWYTSTSYDIGSATTKNHEGQPLEFSRYVLYNSRYAWGGIFTPPPVAGKRRKKPLPGQGLTVSAIGFTTTVTV